MGCLKGSMTSQAFGGGEFALRLVLHQRAAPLYWRSRSHTHTPCVYFDKDEANVGEVIIKDVSHLPEGNFDLFSVTRLQKKGWILTGNADYIKLQKGKKSLLFNIVINTPKEALYVGKFSRKRG
jgi:hypothetical protein